MLNAYKELIINICYLLANFADSLITGELIAAIILPVTFALISLVISLAIVLPVMLPVLFIAYVYQTLTEKEQTR